MGSLSDVEIGSEVFSFATQVQRDAEKSGNEAATANS